MRTAAMLHYLAQRYRLEAIFFRQPGEPDPAQSVPPGLLADSCTIQLPYHGRSPWARTLRNMRRFVRAAPPLFDRFQGFHRSIERFTQGKRYHTAVIEHFWCVPYGAAFPAQRLIADLHNVESIWHRRMAAIEFPWLHNRFSKAYRKLEEQWLPRFHRVLVPSVADLPHLPTGVNSAVYPNTIPVPEPTPTRKAFRIVFSANLEYHPNRAAVRWFARQIWPLLTTRHPTLEWVLAGRAPEAVRSLLPNDARIRLTGPLPSLAAEIASAMVAVVPIQAGSGTRVKILEAWAARTAVVSTRVGAEGLPTDCVELADTPVAFANAVTRLLESEPYRRAMEARAWDLLCAEFTWPAGWNCLKALDI
jgi:glycosyltransferase involved in cell wall biosynthesis